MQIVRQSPLGETMSDDHEKRYDLFCPGCACHITVWSYTSVEARFILRRSPKPIEEESRQTVSGGHDQDAEGDQGAEGDIRSQGLSAGIHEEATGSRKGRPLQSLSQFGGGGGSRPTIRTTVSKVPNSITESATALATHAATDEGTAGVAPSPPKKT
jgi:hypothetical protein